MQGKTMSVAAGGGRCGRGGRGGDITPKAQRWGEAGGLLAGCAISLASCPLAARLLCPARLHRRDLNWPRRLHLTPLPACSAHVYASQIPPGHGQTGRQAVVQRSAAPLHLTKAIWHEAPFGSSSAAAAFPLNCSNQVEGGGKTEGSEAPEGTVPRGHYPPVGAAVRAVVRRERDVTGRLEDE